MFILTLALCSVALVSAIVPGGIDIGTNITAGGDVFADLDAQLKALQAAGIDIPASAFADLDQAELDFDKSQLLTAQAIADANAQIELAGADLKIANAAVIDANVIAAEAFKLSALVTVNADKALRTSSVIALEAGGELLLKAKAAVSAAAIVLEASNKVTVESGATLKAAAISVKGESTIIGDIQVINKHVLDVLADAKLTLGNAAEASAKANVEAKIALKEASSQVKIASETVLSAKSSIEGAGELVVAASLDAKAAAAAEAVKCGKLTVEAAGKLAAKANADAAVLAKVAGEAKLAGELNVDTAADVNSFVVEYGSHVGKFDKIMVNGEAVAEASASSRKREEGKWDVKYEEKKATVSKAGAAGTPSSDAVRSVVAVAAACVALVAALF